jgi:hypothetical protein
MDWWVNLTQGQGTLLSGTVTGVSALFAAFLAVTFFSRKVKSLESALSESQRLLDDHRGSVVRILGDIQERLAVLDTQSGSLIETSARIEGSVSEISDAQPAPGDSTGTEFDGWSELRNRWFTVRDRLEEMAADEQIDGRTRAKYGRIDRRKFNLLIECIESDGNITNKQANIFQAALGLWLRFRNNRASPEQYDLDQMSKFLEEIG